MSFGPLEGSAPAAIHSSITRYSSESFANRFPPPCGIANEGFATIRLARGIGHRHAPPHGALRVNVSKSMHPDSYPRSDSLKPFFPESAPWQSRPGLQPILVTGIT